MNKKIDLFFHINNCIYFIIYKIKYYSIKFYVSYFLFLKITDYNAKNTIHK